MRICTRCRVELDDDNECCPLCGKKAAEKYIDTKQAAAIRHSNASKDDSTDTWQPNRSISAEADSGRTQSAKRGGNSPNYDSAKNTKSLKRAKKEHEQNPDKTPGKRRTIFEFMSISCGAGAIATILGVYLFTRSFNDAFIPVVSIAFGWAIISSAALLAGHPALTFMAVSVLVIAYFPSLDALLGFSGWSLRYAIPLAVTNELILGVTMTFIAKAKRKGANIPAFFLIGATLICFSTDLILDIASGSRVAIGWSAWPALGAMPVAAFMLYGHYRLSRYALMKRIFRL